MESSDWASLPAHILDSIMDNLFHLPDFVRFAAVCKPWFCAAIDNHKNKQKHQIVKHIHMPLLLVPSPNSSENWSLYSISKNKLYDFQLSMPKKRFCGSSFGWLAAVEDDYTISLINPFSSSDVITLPPITSLENGRDYKYLDYYVIKLVLSADPSFASDSFEAAAILGNYTLAVIKSGDKAWTYIDKEYGIDVMYFQGQCHFLDWYYGLKSLVDSGRGGGGSNNIPQVKIIVPTNLNYIPPQMLLSYLVESSSYTGELLQVQRFFNEEGYTSGFKVCKLKPNAATPVWEEVESIGDDALFVGDNFSFSLVASKFPGCQPNSIYYTAGCNIIFEVLAPSDMGIFKLNDKSFRLHYTPNPLLPPPIWIVPKLRGKLGLI